MSLGDLKDAVLLKEILSIFLGFDSFDAVDLSVSFAEQPSLAFVRGELENFDAGKV